MKLSKYKNAMSENMITFMVIRQREYASFQPLLAEPQHTWVWDEKQAEYPAEVAAGGSHTVSLTAETRQRRQDLY